ncbi:MAG: methyltransferase domain-containing protein [Pseudomonadales bacterium]|nr:methyltransferase domain-containing protein [Pseudomonadales bacterium]
MATRYDEHHDFYLSFVDRLGTTPGHRASLGALLDAAGDLHGQTVCDLACGEGFLSRILASQGAQVYGFDLSDALIASAKERSDPAIQYEVQDAEQLEGVASDFFDTVICHLAVMDIGDLDAFCTTANRVLKPGGQLLITLLHPCFETPFDASTGPLVETDEENNFRALRVMKYRSEGFWRSDGTGVRGRVGAHHRYLSTYINTLINSGFQIEQLLEPFPEEISEDRSIEIQWSEHIPRFMTICVRKTN